MVSKLPNVTWPNGSFVETVKGWQQEWFYVTEPRDAAWAATPEFKSGPPMRLTSWVKKGLDWAPSDKVGRHPHVGITGVSGITHNHS